MWYGIKYPHNQRFLGGGGGGQNVALAKVCALLSARSSCCCFDFHLEHRACVMVVYTGGNPAAEDCGISEVSVRSTERNQDIASQTQPTSFLSRTGPLAGCSNGEVALNC